MSLRSRLDRLLTETQRVRDARDTGAWADKESLILESCHPKQRDFVLDPGRRVCALVARGGGKTTAGRARLVRRMLRTPRAQCLYIANTRQQAVELMWHKLKDLLDRLGIAARYNETQLICTLERNSARLRLVGADDKAEVEKLRGQPFVEVGIDEGASYEPKLLDNLIKRVIGPRLGDYDGMIWLIGTPGHVLDGPFYESTGPGILGEDKIPVSRPWADRDLPEYAGWKRWSVHRWNLSDGAAHVPAIARLWTEALKEKDANGWTDQNPIWRREYLGEWAPDDTENVFKYRAFLDDGTPWNFWARSRKVAGAVVPEHAPLTGPNPFGLPGDHQWRYIFGMDLGHSDPFSLVVFAHADTSREIYQVYEYSRTGMYARTVAELLVGPDLDVDKPHGVMGWTGWPDGLVADTAGLGGHLLEELSAVYGVSVEAAEKKNKFDAIELFNGDLVDGRVKVLRGSQLEAELIHLLWEVDDYGKLREDKGQPNHCSDAAIYARRKAAHLWAQDPPPPPPPRGSEAAKNRWAEESEERAAGIHGGPAGREDFTDLLGDDVNMEWFR